MTNPNAEAQPQPAPTTAQLREQLAEYAHEAWSGWMKYLFEKGELEGRMVPFGAGNKYVQVYIMPAWAVERWQRQMNTAYADLPEAEKASDRQEADRMLALMEADRRAPAPNTAAQPQSYTHRNGEAKWPDEAGYYWIYSLESGKRMIRKVERGESITNAFANLYEFYGPIPEPTGVEQSTSAAALAAKDARIAELEEQLAGARGPFSARYIQRQYYVQRRYDAGYENGYREGRADEAEAARQKVEELEAQLAEKRAMKVIVQPDFEIDCGDDEAEEAGDADE